MWDGVDRRRFVRADYPCLITLRKNTPPAEAVLTHTEDISVSGARVIIGKRLELMTEVDIEIDLKDTLPGTLLKGTVSRVKEVPSEKGGTRYDTGIQFIGLKDEDRQRIQKVVEHIKGRG